MSYRRLKIIAIVLTVAAISLFESLRHLYLERVWPAHWATTAAVAALVLGAVAFTEYVFRIIARMEGEIHRLYDESRRRLQETEVLYQIGQEISSLVELDKNLQSVVEKTRRLMRSDLAAWALRDERTGEIYCRAISGAASPDTHRLRLRPGEGLAGQAIASRAPLKIEDFPRDAPLPPEWYPMMSAENLRSAVAMPVQIRGRLFGALFVGNRRPGPFIAEDVRLLGSLASQAAIAIENVHLYRDVQHLAAVEERHRLARELHDGIAQSVAFLHMKLQVARHALDRGDLEEAGRQLAELEDRARATYSEIRHGIFSLKSTPQPGATFAESLAKYLHEFAEQARIEVRQRLGPGAAQPLPAAIEIQLIRIVQEALTNVLRHAHATVVTVEFAHVDGCVEVCVTDDGRGFDPAAPVAEGRHYGLAIMRERAAALGGHCEIESAPGCGTRVRARIPLDQPGGGLPDGAHSRDDLR